MTLAPLFAEPGICKVDSTYASGRAAGVTKGLAAHGRYVDCDHVRFISGFPEKIKGWVSATDVEMEDTPRAMTDFRNNSGAPFLGIGTESHLYYFDGTNIVDITPMRSIVISTLSGPVSTTNGSPLVAIADNTQGLVNGDIVFLSAASAVGGIQLNGWYPVSSVTGTGYNITFPSNATSTAGPGGGTTAINYPRHYVNNPYTTVSGSRIVTVHDVAHGATTGDYVQLIAGTSFHGITFVSQYIIIVVDADNYTITTFMAANASGTGGGNTKIGYDITIGQLSGFTAVAYGVGAYGTGPYGYALTSTPTQYTGWTLAAYGQDLLAAPVGGTIYIYNPIYGGRAYPVMNAPISVLAIFVTPERFLVALGVSGNPMEIAWADQADITVWTTLPSNTANSGRSFQGGTFFVAGIPVANGVSLFFSNRCCFQAAYTGDNEVYNTPLLGDQNGLIGPQAATAHGGIAYWMSDHEFWSWNGAIAPLPSDDIRDYVFENINEQYQSLCVAGTNRAKKEVWFFYPSGNSTEINRYVIYHIDQGVWSIGSMQRTTWHDSDLFTQPYGTDASGRLFAQEIGVNADGVALDAYITYAPADVSNGDRNLDVFGFIPDFERVSGEIDLTVNVQNLPNETATVIGPYNSTSPALLDFRADGKLVGYMLESNVLNGDFRLGVPRANVQPSGARL